LRLKVTGQNCAAHQYATCMVSEKANTEACSKGDRNHVQHRVSSRLILAFGVGYAFILVLSIPYLNSVLFFCGV